MTTSELLQIRGTFSSTIPARFPLVYVRLSSGRTVLVGRHCFSSIVAEDLSEMDRADWTPLTDEETDQAWDLVNLYCRTGSLDGMAV